MKFDSIVKQYFLGRKSIPREIKFCDTKVSFTTSDKPNTQMKNTMCLFPVRLKKK